MVSKQISKNGGFTIPKTVRTEAGLFPGSAVDVKTEGHNIIISPHVPTCRFCGSVDDVKSVLNTEICHKCASEIAKECLHNDDSTEN